MTHSAHTSERPIWTVVVLVVAGVYNLLWGAWVLADPNALFRWAGWELPNYPQIWQCVGMVVGVYGIGYLIAAVNPLRHWPIVLVGLLGKIFGPIGFGVALFSGTLPWQFGLTIVFNDLIWWLPFCVILYLAFRNHMGSDDQQRTLPRREHLMNTVMSHRGSSIRELSEQQPLLLVFLRHSGCTFCREALDDLEKLRPQLEERGVRLALVHMSSPLDGALLAERYGLQDVHRFSDRDCELYDAFGLGRGTWRQLLGWSVIRRGMQAFWRGHSAGLWDGDVFRMPGAFYLVKGRIVASHIHRTAADRPDYLELVRPASHSSIANAS